jgi:hypothetical protein
MVWRNNHYQTDLQNPNGQNWKLLCLFTVTSSNLKSILLLQEITANEKWNVIRTETFL